MSFVADPMVTALVAVSILAVTIAVLLGGLVYRLLLDRGHLLLGLQELRGGVARRGLLAREFAAGAYLPDFALPAPDGAMMTFSDLAGRPLLLVFLRPDCLFSRAFLRELASLSPETTSPLLLRIVTGETDETAVPSAGSAVPGHLLFDRHGQVANLMRITATPSGYLVDAGRRTVGPVLAGPVALLAAAGGSPVPEGDADLLALTAIPAQSVDTPVPLAVGEAAPDFTLPILHGGEWSLAANRGAPLTLIFVDPLCPPCITLFAALGARADPGMVVVSRGAAEHHHLVMATGGAPPLLLQRRREVARAFRSLETPSAYHIDAQGVIAAGPVVGTDAVLSLIDQVGQRNVPDNPNPARA